MMSHTLLWYYWICQQIAGIAEIKPLTLWLEANHGYILSHSQPLGLCIMFLKKSLLTVYIETLKGNMNIIHWKLCF